jgi:glycosyltransferase involved in cell wall biosynthesis
MRIVIDMQGVQTESRFRGIGRYTQALVKSIIRNGKEHEIFLLLNGLFPQTIAPVIKEFSTVLRPEQIKIWDAVGPTAYMDPANDWRRIAANYMRQERIRQIAPDFVLLTTLFEGFGDNFIAAINEVEEGNFLVATILYDLIPLMNPKEYLSDSRVRQWYDAHVKILKKSSILLAISESSRTEGAELLGYPANKIFNISSAVDDQFQPQYLTLEEEHRIRKRFGLSKEYLMYSGATDPRKNHMRLIQAFAQLPDQIRKNHQLAIVGGMPEDHKEAFMAEAKRCGLSKEECRIVGLVDDDSLVKLYNLCKGYIFPSWHEGFGLPALEAIKCGRPVIASNTSSLPEVIGDSSALFDPFNIGDMTAKIYRLLADQPYREELVKKQGEHSRRFNWNDTARSAIDAMKQAADQFKKDQKHQQSSEPQKGYRQLGQQLAFYHRKINDQQLRHISVLLAQSEQDSPLRELLIDISELIKVDANTGIQRVTRAILKALMEIKLPSIRVRPVCATSVQSYHYVDNILGEMLDENSPIGCPVRAAPGDIFLGLDLIHPDILKAQRSTLETFRQRGVKTLFVVYDLIPILYPQFANVGVPEGHLEWLDIVSDADGAICISQTVAIEVKDWLKNNKVSKIDTYKIGHFHLGADIENSVPTHGEPVNGSTIQSATQARPTFLMVGTVEPRKGYQQTIDAFKLLWDKGFDANLIMLGKPGWKADKLYDTITQSNEFNKRLFWLQDASDEYLEKLYVQSTALIAASYCEGFGLPLIEAARHRLPIIARDILIFKEVAQENAYYFHDSAEPLVMSDAIEQWCNKWQQGQHPLSDGMNCLTWRESADQLLEIIQTMDGLDDSKKHSIKETEKSR